MIALHFPLNYGSVYVYTCNTCIIYVAQPAMYAEGSISKNHLS